MNSNSSWLFLNFLFCKPLIPATPPFPLIIDNAIQLDSRTPQSRSVTRQRLMGQGYTTIMTNTTVATQNTITQDHSSRPQSGPSPQAVRLTQLSILPRSVNWCWGRPFVSQAHISYLAAQNPATCLTPASCATVTRTNTPPTAS